MPEKSAICHVDLSEALQQGPPAAGNLAVSIFSHRSLVVELYTPAGIRTAKNAKKKSAD